MLKNYVKASNELEKIILNNLEFYFHLFNSRDYFKQTQHNKKFNMNFFIVDVVLFLILKMLQLRRVMSFKMNVDEQIVRIEQNISPYDVVTIELFMSQLQKSNYLTFHHELIDFLAQSQDEETKINKINMTMHRALCHAIANDQLIIMKK